VKESRILPCSHRCLTASVRAGNYPGLATALGEAGEETFAARVVAEDFLAAIPAIDDVIDGTGIFEAQLASHEGKRVSTSRTVTTEN